MCRKTLLYAIILGALGAGFVLSSLISGAVFRVVLGAVFLVAAFVISNH